MIADSELEEDSVIRNFRITASDGKNYNTEPVQLLPGDVDEYVKKSQV